MINHINMKVLESARLFLNILSQNDSNFIIELVNTEGWIKFIGNRNIHTTQEAFAYIQKINANPNIAYWTVTIRETKQPIGLITLIKRDYLEHPDIGFAFLPSYLNKGYAYEAACAVLTHLIQNNSLTHVLAETLTENSISIKLIEKLGLKFEKEMKIENEVLRIYKASVNQLQLK